ncbi:hypothetical protein QTP70_003022, partial [Hemibagrus guttatus]
QDAASLPSAEDGPNQTFFIFIFVGTRSASLLIGGGDCRPHLPPSLPVGVFGPAGLRSSLISTTRQGTLLGAAARRWTSFGSAARLWTSFGTLRPYRRARRSPHLPRLAPRSSHSPHRVPRSRHLPRLGPRSPPLVASPCSSLLSGFPWAKVYMYERSRTVVRCAVGQTEEFNVEVGLHQGSALSPFLFAIVMDQLSEEVRQESPWTMMFADDIVICSESREQVEENLERWRFALERRGMKVSRSKTEYMCVNEREGSGTVRLQGEEVKKVQEFKYLGSTVQSNGECGKEVKKRVQAGWNGWRKVSGVLCDQKISARIKGKVYRTVVRAAMLYGLETVSLRKRQESELEVAELKMLRFSLGVTRLDRIRNEYIRGTAHVGRLGDKVKEARLRWFGHVQRRDKVSWRANDGEDLSITA